MKILLIHAASPSDPLRANDPFMPLSLPLLAASAPGHDYLFVDMLAGEEVDLQARVDLVGISVRITAERTAFALADAFRARGVKVVLGGAQVSSAPRRALAHADAVVVGEGEALWPRLLEDLQHDRLCRFYVARPGPFDAGGHTVHQLDDFPDLRQVPTVIETRGLYRKRYVFDTVLAARGCAEDCDFCSVTHLFGAKTRLRPAEDVLREIDAAGRFFYLLDDTVFGRPQSHAYYAALFDAVAGLPRRRLWTGQANLDAAATAGGREVIRRAARSGLVYAAIGLESINPAVWRRTGILGKLGAADGQQVLARMREHIRFIQQQGIAISGWFTLGHEEDTPETFDETLAFCDEMQLIPVLCPLEALPGTRLHARLSEQGRLDEKRRINIVHPTMKDEQMLAALRQVNRRAFSLGPVLRRTRFYYRAFASSESGQPRDTRAVVERTLFVYILQRKMRHGLIGLANVE